jgi:beta-carotene 3-hydroxylase
MMFLINALAFLLSFLLMEAVAWLAHKYVMHGLLWFLHDDHHYKDHFGFWEKNDFFFLIFALPGILLMLLGSLHHFDVRFWMGTGIAVYGMAYFFVHDLFIHQRLPVLKQTNNLYLRAVRKAHKMHHKHLGKEDGECFGMLWVPLKYFREAKASKKS